jgi:hypothetical protein
MQPHLTCITSFLVGLVVGILVTTAIAYPRVGRIVSRIVATAGMAAGIGLLTWAVQGMISGVPMRAVHIGQLIVSQPGEGLGWSAALLGGGITALVLSFIGGSSR